MLLLGCSDMGEPVILQPLVAWNPGSIDFGSTTIGHEQNGIITVHNQGEATLTGELILDQDSSNFDLITPSTFELEAGDTTHVQIGFAPTAAANYSATLTIVSNDPNNDEVLILLSGVGVVEAVPALQLSVNSLDFESQVTGSSSMKQFNLSSTGTDTLFVDSITVGNTAYSIDLATPTFILPGSTVAVSVTFLPSAAGDYNSQIRVYSNVSTSPHQIDITANATDAVSYSASVQPIWNANCTGCHGNSAGLDLGSYAQLMSGSNSGAVVTAGDGANSIIVQRLKGIGGSRMPLNGPALPSQSVELIETWIDQGALDN